MYLAADEFGLRDLRGRIGSNSFSSSGSGEMQEINCLWFY